MDYDEFKKELKKEVEHLFACRDTHYTIKLCKVRKNNGVEFDTFCICEDHKNAGLNIYVDSYFNDYRAGKSIIDIAAGIIEYYIKMKDIKINNFDNIFELNSCKRSIYLRLVNYNRNSEILKNAPHIRYLDLAITFRYGFFESDGSFISTLVCVEFMKNWGVSLDELYRISFINTVRDFPFKVKSLSSILIESILNELEVDKCKEIYQILQAIDDEINMYVCTNVTGINGATCILYNNVLQKFSKEFNCNVFILPSSIHELLLVPETSEFMADFLRDLVVDVNKAAVSDVDFLSDNVYYYNRVINTVTIV